MKSHLAWIAVALVASTTALPQTSDSGAALGENPHFVPVQKKQQTAVSNNRIPGRSPKQISKHIEKFVLDDLKTTPRDQTERWHFTPDNDAKILRIAESRGPLSLDPNDPYLLPIEAQFDVESMSQFLADSVVPVPDSMPLLREIRSGIHQLVVDLQTVKNKERQRAALERGSGEMNRKLGVVKDRIIKSYRDHNYRVTIVAGYEVVQVPIATEPAGGTIRVMKYLTYKKCLAFGIQRTVWPWLTLNQNPARLVGRYRYLVSWPNGNSAEGDMSVMSADPLVFRPLH